MARRKKNEGLLEIFSSLPWQASLIAGSIFFFAMYWIVPGIFAGKPLMMGLSALSRSLSWVPLLLFGVTGLIAFARTKNDAPDATPYTPTDSKKRKREPVSSPNVSGVDAAWGRANPPDLPSTGTEWGRGAAHRHVAGFDPSLFTSWTVEALRALEWKCFELLCAKYYESVGFRSETIRAGADGGIDIKLFKIDPAKPLAIVQCKAWASDVGVKEVRELRGVMANEKVTRGVFITTAGYTKDALIFGQDNAIQLLSGQAFIEKVKELPTHRQEALWKFAFTGDYATPTCASCGIKMVRRDSKRGPFWGCAHYPRCKSTFAMKSA